MIVSQAEIEFVKKGRCRRMLLPVIRGQAGAILQCPLEQGDLVSLQTKPFAKGVKVTVLAAPRRVETGEPVLSPFITPDREALRDGAGQWEVVFALGNHTPFFTKHRERYLKRTGIGLTTNPGQAVPGEPAVTTAEQLEIARKAREKRDLEQRQRWQANRQGMLALLADMRAAGGHEQDIRFIERRLAKMARQAAERAA